MQPRSRRSAALPVLLGIFALTATACASPAQPTVGPSSTAPAGSTPVVPSPGAPSPTPAPTAGDALVVTLAQLTGDAPGPSLIGQRVRVTGSYVATADRQVLADLLMESYPPQAGGSMIDLLGQMPQEIADRLDSTADEPDLAQVTWGYVEIIGIVRQNGLEMEQVRIVES